MAEEDEIDVLGDYSLESFFSRNETDIDSNLGAHSYDESNCDCGSQWFGGNQSTIEHASWCKKVKMYTDFTQPDQDINLVGKEVLDETGWTRSEKNMLDRGIEIFGRSSSRLAQFIGTKTPSEIKYYLTHFYKPTNVKVEIVSHPNAVSNIRDSAFLQENDIPACIEEVVVQVSTASPTVSCRQHSGSDSLNIEHPRYGVPGRTAFFKGDFPNSSDVKPKKRKKVTSLDAKHSRFKGGLPKKQAHKINPELDPNRCDVNYIDGGKTVVTSVNGEEVVKIEKVASDDEVDIENSDSDVEKTPKRVCPEELKPSKEIIQVPPTNVQLKVAETVQCEPIKSESKDDYQIDLSVLKDDVVRQLCDEKPPKCEIVLDENRVTDLERSIHFEFFDGRPTKTELRYLKIRNHIINTWVTSKPNYVTKTSMRLGLKKCGDVSCISRIHQYLERIGAINFGCAQTTYSGSLYDLMTHPVTMKEKPKKSERESSVPSSRLFFGSRPRSKKNFDSDGKGGHTSTHDESGKVINTFVVSEEPVVKPKTNKKIPTNLIYCRSFMSEKVADYSVELYLSTVLLMDLHSHMSYTEVMGLIGGQWDSQRKVLTIMRYVPCRSLATSATHCEMCPLSQADAGDSIHNEGLDILGWFHSHPTFAPEPSEQDLETQLLVQEQIGCNKPCVGLILSPFSEAATASPFRCLMVKNEGPKQIIPYKFKVKLLTDQICPEQLLKDAKHIFNFECDNTNMVNFGEAYFLDATISHLEKFLSSVKMHLAKCSSLSKVVRENILTSLEKVCED